MSAALLVWVSHSLVFGVGLGVVGRWVLLGVGPRHSWLRAWWAALLVGLPFRPSAVSGDPAPLLAEGRWVFWVFVCCVCLWCGRCSRLCVLCVFVGLVLVAAVVVCVVCARLCVWCVCIAFGCLSSPLWASVGGSVWVWGLCVMAPLPPWLWGLGVVPRHSWLGSVGGGVFPRRPLCVPSPLCLFATWPGALFPWCLVPVFPGCGGCAMGLGGGEEGSLTLAWVPSSGVSPWRGRCLHST